MKKKLLMVVVGPTAVGKTAIAIRLAQHFQTEIISSDARQVFKELNIGTAKPSPAELALISHHFIGSYSIHDDFNAGAYALEAEDLIKTLFNQYDKLILCGGSGLYIKALLHGFDEMPDVPASVRQRVIAEYQEKGLEWLQQIVMDVDPVYYYPSDKLNPQRLMRALEIFRASGKPFSSFKLARKKVFPFNIIKIGLNMDRAELYARIDQRIHTMITDGLFQEAEKLYAFKDFNALQTVGYQEIFGFMDGKYDQEAAVQLIKRNSRRYAKRQLTWFGSDNEISWFSPKEYDSIIQFILEKSNAL